MSVHVSHVRSALVSHLVESFYDTAQVSQYSDPDVYAVEIGGFSDTEGKAPYKATFTARASSPDEAKRMAMEDAVSAGVKSPSFGEVRLLPPTPHNLGNREANMNTGLVTPAYFGTVVPNSAVSPVLPNASIPASVSMDFKSASNML